MLELYQIIIVLMSLITILLVSKRFHNDTLSIGTYLEWLFIWVLIIIVAIFPGISVEIASIAGLGRGLDAIYILSIIILFYLLFKLYNKIEDQKKRINELVSELAVQNGNEDEY